MKVMNEIVRKAATAIKALPPLAVAGALVVASAPAAAERGEMSETGMDRRNPSRARRRRPQSWSKRWKRAKRWRTWTTAYARRKRYFSTSSFGIQNA